MVREPCWCVGVRSTTSRASVQCHLQLPTPSKLPSRLAASLSPAPLTSSSRSEASSLLTARAASSGPSARMSGQDMGNSVFRGEVSHLPLSQRAAHRLQAHHLAQRQGGGGGQQRTGAQLTLLAVLLCNPQQLSSAAVANQPSTSPTHSRFSLCSCATRSFLHPHKKKHGAEAACSPTHASRCTPAQTVSWSCCSPPAAGWPRSARRKQRPAAGAGAPSTRLRVGEGVGFRGVGERVCAQTRRGTASLSRANQCLCWGPASRMPLDQPQPPSSRQQAAHALHMPSTCPMYTLFF